MDFVSYVFMTRLVAQLRNDDINRRYMKTMKRLCGDVEYSPAGVLVPSRFGTPCHKRKESGQLLTMPSKKCRTAGNFVSSSTSTKIFSNFTDLSDNDFEKVGNY